MWVRICGCVNCGVTMWLDAAPILREVARRGGLAWTLPHELPTPVGSADTSRFLSPPRPVSLVERPELLRIRRAYHRMKHTGMVSDYTADWFCIRVLGMLPNELYGPVWFDTVEEWDHEHVWHPDGCTLRCRCGDTMGRSA